LAAPVLSLRVTFAAIQHICRRYDKKSECDEMLIILLYAG